MKKYSSVILLILFLLSTFNLCFSQGSVTVKLDVFLPDGGVMYLSDLGLIDAEHAPLLFALTIQNTSPTSKQVLLKFGIRRGDELLIEGITKPFDVPPSAVQPGGIYLTNQNIFNEGMNYSLQDVDITDASEQLKNTILSTGKLPSGAYTFYVEILDDQNQTVLSQDSHTLMFSTPSLLDLVSPGAPADRGKPPEIYTKLPFFQWDSDASKFEITVCERLPGNTDPQDVMRNEPRLQRIVEDQKFYQYPADAWELMEGKTYYWQVAALIPTVSGEIRLESEIWRFRVANLSEGGNSAEQRHLMMMLKVMFDSQNFSGLFGEGGPLEGFHFTGSAILNGKRVSVGDLTSLLNDLLKGNIKIIDFSVE